MIGEMGVRTRWRRRALEARAGYRELRAVVEQKVAPVEPELGLVSRLADGRGAFLDVGANRGYYALTAVPHFPRVVAVEANPDLAAGLRETFGRAVDVRECALSDSAGETTMWIPTSNGRDLDFRGSLQESANPGFDQRRITVRTTRVDDLGITRLAAMKIDVEGHELTVLHGAEQTLRATRPSVILESEERHNAGGVDAVLALLAGHGYDGWFWHRGRLRPVADFSLAEHQDAGAAKPVGAPKSEDYVNNFLFVPSERGLPQGLAAARG
ncbi:FkbM family methyltransferase [Marmoricola endophyticus]|nr:FkbM family methyltransferase [Marmoricola endophyticus]